MICPQCGKHYAENEGVCRLCGVPLRSACAAARTTPENGPVRPGGIDQTLESIRQDINVIDQCPLRPAGFFIRLMASADFSSFSASGRVAALAGDVWAKAGDAIRPHSAAVKMIRFKGAPHRATCPRKTLQR